MPRLPEFRHEVVDASASRVFELVENKTNGCVPNLFKTPAREAKMEFSEPLMGIIPNGLVILRSNLPAFKPFLNEAGELRFGQLLSDGKYRVATITGRSFGPGIDAVLKEHAGKPAISIVPSTDHFATRLLKLATQKEYHAVIGYATELRYVTRESKLNIADFVFLPVVEERTPIPMYVGCSKAEPGRKAIAAINRALSDANVRRELRNAYRAWLDEETAERFDKLNKAESAKRSNIRAK